MQAHVVWTLLMTANSVHSLLHCRRDYSGTESEKTAASEGTHTKTWYPPMRCLQQNDMLTSPVQKQRATICMTTMYMTDVL